MIDFDDPRPTTWPGLPYPLGVHWDGRGINVAVFSETAAAVDLCLFGDADQDEVRIPLEEKTGFTWHAYVPQIGPGQRYGFRVHGDWAPERGVLSNPAKLLIDPYARAIEGDLTWEGEGERAIFGYDPDDPDRPDDLDSAPYVPKSVVVNPFFYWGHDHPIDRPWSETVIYETHVRGATMRHPGVPPELRGTYAGMASPAMVDHLVGLGVTAVQLQPVHHFLTDHFLWRKGLAQYWGYNSIGYMAPHAAYASQGGRGAQVYEFKAMVADLHAAGLEVILDVVYNHTGEGGRNGPTLSLRGLDNPSYYRLDGDDPRNYVDYTGTGNSMNVQHPNVLQMIMDSLRYWITEMRVDGFRFDLAAALARELHDVDRLSAFFDIIQQDPVISRVKLIAEPWDLGDGGYQVGNFPTGWTELNGKYRDTVRDWWHGHGDVGAMASRLSGSSDLYAHNGRRPYASINFVTAHDGFTLADLVSYERKHNEANLDGGTSGEDHNRSHNHGVEGPTDDPAIREIRARQQRNFLATLLLSQGVPMLLGGDEFGRTQQGNNNAYCIDSALTHYDWEGADTALFEFTRRVLELRQRHPVLRRRTYFTGEDDLHWLSPDGTTMEHADWHAPGSQALGFFLNGQEIPSRDIRGRRIVDDTFLVLLNGAEEPLDFVLPPASYGTIWRAVLDTADPWLDQRGGDDLAAGTTHRRPDRSLVLLRRITPAGPGATPGHPSDDRDPRQESTRA